MTLTPGQSGDTSSASPDVDPVEAPEALSPEALSPEALSPEALSPEALSPEALSPEARSPEALSPEARAIEAVLMVAVEPVPAGLLAELLEVPVEQIDPLCDELAESCRRGRRGFEVARIAGGFRIQTHPDLAAYVERFANIGVSSRLSAAALETLAIVAYKQPVSRAQIANLRGVNVDGVVRLLEHRGYIAPVGRAAGPGQAVLYATTEAFLERLGLDRLDQLPPVEDLLPGPEALDDLEDQMRPTVDG